MSIVGWIILGAIAGWIASVITKRNKIQGCIGNIIVGIIGAMIGGFIVALLGGEGFTGFNLPSLLVAILGSVILLAGINFFFGRA